MASRVSIIRQQYVKRWRMAGFTLMCGLCKRNIDSSDEITVDHIKPRSKGGKHRTTNLQPAHKACNEAKGNEYPELPATVAQTFPGAKLVA